MASNSKIVALLENAGCKPELTEAIVNTLEEYKIAIREQFEADYTAKVAEAKRICVEETESHKIELSRALQVFLETKEATISTQLARQASNNESEAVTKLRNVKNLLEGVQTQNGDNAVNSTVVESVNKKLLKLQEQYNLAIDKANRQTAIAEKVLARNRALLAENVKLRSNAGTTTRKPAQLAEGAQRRKQTRRIDNGRLNGTPVSTRPTLVESQSANTRPLRQQPHAGTAIEDIAANMGDI